MAFRRAGNISQAVKISPPREMPRPRRDGTAPAAPQKHKLNELFLRKLEPRDRTYAIWDTHQRGLAARMQPSGRMSWVYVYSANGRPRWYTIGAADAIGLADARKTAGELASKVAQGHDPCAERKLARDKGTFGELADRYLDEHAKRRNKSWQQADKLVRRHLIPRWGTMQATAISRQDIKAALRLIKSEIVANQTLAAASAIFSFGMREEIVTANPCAKIERNPTKSRDRVLSDRELPLFWNAFLEADEISGGNLRFILLSGQRPGEVRHLCREHIVDGWWEMPGVDDPALGWPGTKNGRSHRVWLPEAAQQLLSQMPNESKPFRGKPVSETIRKISVALNSTTKAHGDPSITPVRPHDLRRTHGTTITRLGFGRDALNRIQNHAEGGIASVYDRHQYADENKRIMEAVAEEILSKVGGAAT
ncbi:MAG: integrase arm-type DNA-binding domain-containing protein [Pseudolabrys sp.]|nr:integrase arm-type DNA-binding domain-containing protein [Pseudolabrys sp.]